MYCNTIFITKAVSTYDGRKTYIHNISSYLVQALELSLEWWKLLRALSLEKKVVRIAWRYILTNHIYACYVCSYLKQFYGHDMKHKSLNIYALFCGIPSGPKNIMK